MTTPTSGDALATAFEEAGSLFELLRTVRSRRVGLGYRVDSGLEETHPATGRSMTQPRGPQEFVSTKPVLPLSQDEKALLAWATLGPTGHVAWEASVGSFSQLASTRGRTAPEPNNSLATDLFVIDDAGVHLYAPAGEEGWPLTGESITADDVRSWWARGRVRVADSRPDLDYALRFPGAPNTPLMGTHQYNLNRPGSAWLLPVTDAGRLMSGILDLFLGKRTYLIDDHNGGRPTGLDAFLRAGLLERPLPLTAYEQGVLRTSTYPAGCMVQNTRLAAEALGLGAWCLSGYDQSVVLGAHPEVTAGLGFQFGPTNDRAPLVTARRHTWGLPGVKAATSVPSPTYPDPASLVEQWRDERFGDGAWGDPKPQAAPARGPWSAAKAAAIAQHPDNRIPDWVFEAAVAHIQYCVDQFGQFPATYDPVVAGFGTVVHHLDVDFYEQHLRPGYLTSAITGHQETWHDPS